MSARLVTDTPLRVAPELVGAPLASPLRRAVALAIDGVLVLLPSLALATGAAWVSLRASDPRCADAVRTLVARSAGPDARRAVFRDLLPLLERTEAAGVPAAARAAIEEHDLDRAAALLADYDVNFTLSLSEHEAEPPPKGTIRVDVGRLIPRSFRALSLFGLAGAYFTLLTASRHGQTVGKRLLRIRVVGVSGERVSAWESLERFGGYFHVGGTVGLGLIDLWHEPNRRLAHDRIAGTLVIRALSLPRPAVEPSAASAPPESSPPAPEPPRAESS